MSEQVVCHLKALKNLFSCFRRLRPRFVAPGNLEEFISMGRRKDRIAKEDYSSDSGESEDGEEQGDYGEFESFTQPFRRKKRRHGKKSKEDTILGIFGDESSDDDRDLMHKNIRYKEVNFVEKEDDEEESKSQIE